MFLPDAKNFLFSILETSATKSGVWIGSLDSNQAILLIPGKNISGAVYADPGFIIYSDEGPLRARRFVFTDGKLGDETITTGAINNVTIERLNRQLAFLVDEAEW